ncbi:hypothetical protein HZH68_016745 [Vespula germanica]|uniref:Uncharacterized protein n=1 Tax=Vespula germanica TaxID=30212 RepID=A0A834J382_VESGE|nr:hypothetical protein HZH68_016745 [Vespula germanica]
MVPVGQEWGYESTQISDSIKRVCFHPKLNKGTIDTPYHVDEDNNTVAFKDYSSGRFFPSPGTAGTQDDHVLSRLQRAIPA